MVCEVNFGAKILPVYNHLKVIRFDHLGPVQMLEKDVLCK